MDRFCSNIQRRILNHAVYRFSTFYCIQNVIFPTSNRFSLGFSSTIVFLLIHFSALHEARTQTRGHPRKRIRTHTYVHTHARMRLSTRTFVPAPNFSHTRTHEHLHALILAPFTLPFFYACTIKCVESRVHMHIRTCTDNRTCK